jgi:hypothetical protein
MVQLVLVALVGCLVPAWWCGGKGIHAFSVQQRRLYHGHGHASSSRLAPASRFDTTVLRAAAPLQPSTANQVDPTTSLLVQSLLRLGRQYGPVGDRQPQDVRDRISEIARRLPKSTTAAPARYPLTGTHDLVYSSAEGFSSGKLGPFDGIVQQEFIDDITFRNSVRLGPLTLTLTATREIRDDETIIVTFRSTTARLFEQTIVSRPITGGGVWKILFTGTIVDEDDDRRTKLVRVLEAPSLFVLEQVL